MSSRSAGRYGKKQAEEQKKIAEKKEALRRQMEQLALDEARLAGGTSSVSTQNNLDAKQKVDALYKQKSAEEYEYLSLNYDPSGSGYRCHRDGPYADDDPTYLSLKSKANSIGNVGNSVLLDRKKLRCW